MEGPRIIVALDYDNTADCLTMVDRLDPALCRLKVGKELFTSCGPQLVRTLIRKGFDIFLDLKFHDIPNTVAKAVKAAADLGVWMVNVHACGGESMMVAAQEALASRRGVNPLLIGVTVLTSMDTTDLQHVGVDSSLDRQVLRLAQLTKNAGLDGVVCSAREAPMLRQHFGEAFCLVTPGIRPVNSGQDDQRRVLTPQDAVKAGSSYLVIGRPITQAADPAAACRDIASAL